MNLPDLIVTTPHGKCDMMNTKRSCDLAAALAGQILCSVAQAQGVSYAYLPGDEFRLHHDLNRRASRETPYRRQLADLLGAVRDSGSLLIDVHSFPDYYMKEAGNINFFKQGETPPDIVVLEGPANTWHGRPLAQTLYDALHNAGLRVRLLRGITVNDIMQQAAEHDVPGVLLEYNEAYNRDPESLKRACQVVLSVLRGMAASAHSRLPLRRRASLDGTRGRSRRDPPAPKRFTNSWVSSARRGPITSRRNSFQWVRSSTFGLSISASSLSRNSASTVSSCCAVPTIPSSASRARASRSLATLARAVRRPLMLAWIWSRQFMRMKKPSIPLNTLTKRLRMPRAARVRHVDKLV